ATRDLSRGPIHDAEPIHSSSPDRGYLDRVSYSRVTASPSTAHVLHAQKDAWRWSLAYDSSVMDRFISDVVLRYGYLAVFVLMVGESAALPIPSEVVMPFGGALANAAFVAGLGSTGHHLNFGVVVVLGALANLVGSWIAYGLGRIGGRPLMKRWS